jgi:hypothetical protein
MDDVSVLTLLKEPFMNTIGEVIRQHDQSQVEKLKQLEIFKNWTLAHIASLYRHFSRKSMPFGSFVYKKGDRDENFYVIIKGEVEVRHHDLASRQR